LCGFTDDDLFTWDGSSWTEYTFYLSGNADAVTHKGELYFISRNTDRVRKVDTDFNDYTVGGAAGVGTCSTFNSLASYDGNLYASCGGDNKVYVHNNSTGAWNLSGTLDGTPDELIVVDNELLCSVGSAFWKYDGASWSKEATLQYTIPATSTHPVYDNKGIFAYEGFNIVWYNPIRPFSGDSSFTSPGNIYSVGTFGGNLYLGGGTTPVVYSTTNSGASVKTLMPEGPHVVTITYSSSNISIQVDDDEAVEEAHSVTLEDTSYPLYLGRSIGNRYYTNATDQAFQGKIRALLAYRGSLSDIDKEKMIYYMMGMARSR